jgi:transposase InsO family protein
MDHTELNIDVEKRGSGKTERPWLTIMMDADTRMIVGSRVSSEPLTEAQMAQFLDELLGSDDDKEGN